MPEPIKIEWQSKGLKGIADDLDTVAAKMEKANQVAEAGGNGGGRKRGRSGGNVSSSEPVSSGASARSSKPPTVPPLPAFAKAAQTQQGRLGQLIQQAQAAGNAPAAAALQKKLDKVNGSGFTSRLLSVATGATKGSGGKVGSMLSALAGTAAEGAEAGPIGLLTAGAIAAAEAMAQLTARSAEVAQNFSKLQFATGSDSATTGKLKSLAAAGGMDESSVGSLAESFHKRITEDPMGRVYAARLGVNAGVAGPFGNQDYGSQLLQAIKGLRKITNFTERVRVARATGLESALPLTNISDRQFRKSEQDSDLTSKYFTPELQTKAADFEASLGRMKEASDNAAAAVGNALLPGLTGFANELADATNKFAAFAQDHGDLIKGAAGIANPLLGVAGIAGDLYNKFGGGGSDPNTNALNANTAAMRANTAAVAGQPGVYGNSPRLGRALGFHFDGDQIRALLQEGGFIQGVF